MDGQEIEESLDESGDPILGAAELARAVVHDDLGDLEASLVGQDGDEAVELAVERDLVEDLAAIGLEAAVVVVELAAGQAADEPVEDPAGADLVPGVVPGPLPAADDVVPFVELGQEPGDLGRVVLEVAVEGEDDRALRRPEARRERRGLAEVAAEPDAPDPRVGRDRVPDHPPRAVAAAVVDEEELGRPEAVRLDRSGQLGVEGGQALGLVDRAGRRR